MHTAGLAPNAESQKLGSTSSISSCSSTSLACPYKEIYYLSLGSQSNIYCSFKLPEHKNSDQRLFVASLRGKVSCLETGDQPGIPGQPQSSEVYFTYIPGDAEIISMHGFCKSKHTPEENSCELVIGITLIVKKSPHGEQGPKCYFNIYIYHPDVPAIATFEKTTQMCQHQLNFTPYHLTSTVLYDSVRKEYQNVFLLSGSDCKVHVFREVRSGQKYAKHTSNGYFPEFGNAPGSITWMDIKLCANNFRITAWGCENGYLKVAVVDTKECVVLNSWSSDQDGPISSVKLFTLRAGQENDMQTTDECGLNENPLKHCSVYDVNLLVTSALEVATVYLDVGTSGLDKMVILPRSDSFDSVTCSHVADVDLDGHNEILIGTYGQELLAYKWHDALGEPYNSIHFDILWTRGFSKPLFSVLSIDLLSDGLAELAVTSLAGVHVLQHDVNQVADLLSQRLDLESKTDKEENPGGGDPDSP